MANIPKDLKKAHQKFEELIQEKGDQFASGFMDYMLNVDYRKRDPNQVLQDLLWLHHPEAFQTDIEDMLSGQVDSDLVDGFKFGEQYSQEAQYSYQN